MSKPESRLLFAFYFVCPIISISALLVFLIVSMFFRHPQQNHFVIMCSQSVMKRSISSGAEYLNIDPDFAITTVSGSVSGFAATVAKQPIQRVKWIKQVIFFAPIHLNVGIC
jgi:hypothetical protein